MMHRMLRFPAEWEWHALYEQRPETSGLSRRRNASGRLSETKGAERERNRSEGSPAKDTLLTAGVSKEAVRELVREHPELAGWPQETSGRSYNHILVTELPGGEPVLQGTLLFQVSEDRSDISPLHFWISDRKLFTIHSDLRLSVRLQQEPWDDKLVRCDTAPEGFFVIVSLILETFHQGLDAFEISLGGLEEQMRRGNRTGLMNVIFERRYDLLHWNHLFIPVRELHGAAKEAFMSALTEREEFKRMEFKLLRISELLDHYAHEIDTLLSMDEAIADFRGNDIMKTLTIFTALFTPAAVIGSIWGMNFNRIPWSDEPWGFAVIAFIIVLSMAAIYWWLWRKGWTGDILHGRHPKEIITPVPQREVAESIPPGEDMPLPSRSTAIQRTPPPQRAPAPDDPLPSRSSRKA
ncbi:magnesium transporter CorA family protein [Paenibacillus humicola]|uniref:magnesium transporter CorA family protein n=1 Tax=Paenibacillus humicola TaxID=3110540 RepID=UPI00237A5DAB|nr:magnesium transporter CorA family protein [Paenibacillus humicola]